MIETVLCPGGNGVYYTFGPEALLLATAVLALCTGSIVFFGLNLRSFLNKDGCSRKLLFSSSVWVMLMSILNVVTFIYFIKPEETSFGGPTTTGFDWYTIVVTLIVIIGFCFVVWSLTKTPKNKNGENKK